MAAINDSSRALNRFYLAGEQERGNSVVLIDADRSYCSIGFVVVPLAVIATFIIGVPNIISEILNSLDLHNGH